MQLQDEEFQQLSRYMHANYGITLEKKRSLIEGRLSTSLERKGYTSFAEYIDRVIVDHDDDELMLLLSKLTTNYTYFMREEKHYQELQKTVLPGLVARLRDKDIRTWSAGCSSGEEPYTTAMVYREFFGYEKSAWDTTILATDISENVLNRARKGFYAKEALKWIPDKWRTRYFHKRDEDTYEIIPELRAEVIFSNFNLMEPVFPFRKKFHVIFCRNVMIYFDSATREALAAKFHQALEPGGYFFIGLSETLANLKTDFKYVMPSIYRKE